jgi:hypothetical protein
MLKNFTISALMFSPFLAYATDSMDVAGTQSAAQLMQKQGLPLPDGGIILKPLNQFPHYEELKVSMETDKASIKQYGYIKKSSPEILSLLNFKMGNKKFSARNLTASADTGLYQSINDIQMAYRYYGVPVSAMTNALAVAPAGTFIQGQGWTGAAQTFEKAGIGICTYNELNARLAHGSVLVAQETATNDVNGKITQKYAKGQEGEGFIYGVSWYDDTIYHELECAQPDFSTEAAQAVTNLAIAIDNNSH